MVYVYFFDDKDESKNIGIPEFRLVDGYNQQTINITKDQAQDILDNLDFESHVRLKSIADDLSTIFGKDIVSSTKAIPVKTDEELVSNQYLEAIYTQTEKYNPETDPLADKYMYYVSHYYNEENPSPVQPYIDKN